MALRAWLCAFQTLLAVAPPPPPAGAATAQNDTPGQALPDRVRAKVAGGDLDGAIALARQALVEALGTTGALPWAAELDDVGQILYKARTPQTTEAAEALFERALQLIDQTGGPDALEAAPVLGHLADLHFEQGRRNISEELDRRALALKTRVLGPEHPEVGVASKLLGMSLSSQGRFGEAEEPLARAVRILENASPRDPLAQAYALKELAENYRAANLYREARPLYERALALAEAQVGSRHPDLVELLINLGGLYRDLNLYAESEWRMRQALEILSSTEDPSPGYTFAVWNNLAELKRFQGDRAEAERLYLRALETAERVWPPGHPRRATCLNQLALLHVEQGRYAEAEPRLREALRIKREALGADHPDVAFTLNDLGRLHLLAGDYPAAEKAFAEALDIREARLGREHPEAAITLVSLAETRLASGRSEASEQLERAIRSLDLSPAEPRTLARALSLQSRLAERSGDTATARRSLERSLGIVETLRPVAGGGEQTRARFLAEYIADFDRMVFLLLRRGEIARAFEYAERSRSRVLLDQLASAGVDLRNGIAPSERPQWDQREADVTRRLAELGARLTELRALATPSGAERARIAELEREHAAAGNEFRQVYEGIKNASRFWRGRASDGAVVSLAAAQRDLLSPRSLLLVYVIGADESAVFVVPPVGGKPASFRLEIPTAAAGQLGVEAGPLTASRLARVLKGASADAAASDHGLLDELATPPSRSRARRVGLGRRLAALREVLAPAQLWPQIRRSSEVLIVPDGLLHQFPFEVLVTGGSPERPRYWLDDGPVTRYAASATALARLGRASTPVASDAAVLSVSDPVYDPSEPPGRPRLVRLPGTAAETRAIVAAFQGTARVEVLQRHEATEPRVRRALARKRYVHIATHGLVDTTQGDLFATLVLTAPASVTASADDGQLQLFEIYDLDLDAELATLSACVTRAGTAVPGEGVFALSRAFMAAGARRVVASVWEAEDESTAGLMGSLFGSIASALRAGRPPDYARALAEAKRQVRARPEWEAPFFWAPFILDGVR